MKSMKKCAATNKNIINYKRRSSAGLFNTSSAGAVTSLILMCVLCGLVNLCGFFNAADTYALDRISMTIDTNKLAIDVADIAVEGKFSQSSNMNISVATSSNYGYTLGMASSTGSTDLTSGNNTISSITSSIDQATFSDAANTQYNNKWGYKPSTLYDITNDTSSSNTNFLPLPNTTGQIIDKTDEANSTPNTYTLSIGTRIDYNAPIGDYISDAFIITAVANTATIPCDDTKLCVEYDGNGLTYTGDWLNRVNYNSTTTQGQVTKYSHTPNISDAGVQNGNYANSYTMNDVVTIDGATSLHIKLTYGGESASYDWVSFWPGNHPDYTASGNYSTGVQNCGGGTVTNGKYGGTNGTTVECDITASDGSVTFAFKSDVNGVGNGYGYYAVITGIGTVVQLSVSSGQYATPTGTNALFYGWSTTETAPGGGLPSQVEYTNESEVMTKMPGDEGEVKTLYAVWQQGQAITFTMDSNVSSIAVLNSDGTTAGTITASGQSLVLAQGDTYTIKPTHATGYATNAITRTSGVGTLSGKNFTVGAGSATINITSRQLLPIQNYDCSNLANVGDTDTVYDTRDNETYLIGKLKDGKCWMLENLNLAGGTTLTSTDTDMPDDYTLPTANNFQSDNRLPASATAGFKDNTKASVYNSGNKENCGASNQNTPCYSYYSWTAATLASGLSISTDNTDAPYSICPKGWKLPTSRTTSASNWQTTSDFYVMAHQYGLDSTTSFSESDSDFYNQAGPGTLPGFLLAGYYSGSSFSGGGTTGSYWSATSGFGSGSAHFLYFHSSLVNSASGHNRNNGRSVRCLLGS